MNRALLKQDAKDAMRAANPHPAVTTLVLFAVVFGAVFVIYFISFMLGMTAYVAGSRTALLGLASIVLPILCIVYILLACVLQFGYVSYCLKVFKLEATGVSELFSHFRMVWKVLGLSLWMSIFVSLWSILFVIPGIIAQLRYSQAFYILAENPDMSIRECVNESKSLMSGRLWEFFVLQLSFLPWILLSYVTCCISLLYVAPYMQTTFAGYYLSLKPYIPYRETYSGEQAGSTGYDSYNNTQQF